MSKFYIKNIVHLKFHQFKFQPDPPTQSREIAFPYPGDLFGPPCIFKTARPVRYGLRPAVEENIKDLTKQGILKQVPSSSWATPIVTPLKLDERPRICGDFRVTINPFLKQANTTKEAEDMFRGLNGATQFS